MERFGSWLEESGWRETLALVPGCGQCAPLLRLEKSDDIS